MKIVVDINHPAHVHYFKHFIWESEKRGHEILITASNKDIAFALLQNYGLSFHNMGTYGSHFLEKLIKIPILDWRMYRTVKGFNPDIFIGFGSIRAAHTSKMLGKPYIALDDTEHAKLGHLLYVPFSDAILTPACFKKDFGKKHIHYDGYSELLYLHPKYFNANPAVLDDIGIDEGEPFCIVRFVAWNSHHDINQFGIKNKVNFVKKLENYGKIFISSENKVPNILEKYQITLSPEKIHDLLHYASLYVGEGATMATEAAILGTPSVYISSLANTMGNFIELEEKYRLLYVFNNEKAGLSKAIELLQLPNAKANWLEKREKLLEEKIDVTAFLLWFIENYPQSFAEISEDPEIQIQLKKYRSICDASHI